MANPNIVNVSSINGLTTSVSIGNTNTMNVLVSNAASSNKVLKINTILAANDDVSSGNVEVTVKVFNQAAGAGTSFSLANSIVVPYQSSIVLLGKDSPIYLNENMSISAAASAANDVDIVCSYEEIS